MTGGFLLAVIAVVLSVIVAAPQYAEPAPEPAAVPVESALPSLDPETEAAAPPVAVHEEPTSKPPGKLRGYRWPVRGGMVATYYEPDGRGIVEIEGQPIHDGLVITWFEGAVVKAAHKGTVIAAGRDWATHAGFDGTLDDVYSRYAKGNGKKGQKPAFPMGIVVDDGNGYYSVYSELKGLLVKPGDKVTAGQPIGRMSKAEQKQMMRYRLVRMDGRWMKVNEAARKRGYPDYARERIDPLAVLNLDANKAPQLRGKPKDPPRRSEY